MIEKGSGWWVVTACGMNVRGVVCCEIALDGLGFGELLLVWGGVVGIELLPYITADVKQAVEIPTGRLGFELNTSFDKHCKGKTAADG